VLIAVPALLHGQRYNFRFYGQDDGLQNLAVQVVLQDRAGFMWVGTQNGLFRYDGARFVPYGKDNGLPGSRIESLHESIDGTLWVGTPTGVVRRQGDRFVSAGGPTLGGVNGRQAIASDRQGTLYLATAGGLLASSGAGDRIGFRPIPQAGSEPAVASVYVDAGGTVWYGCGSSLCVLENESAREAGPQQGLPSERWDAILGDLDGNLWVRGERSLYVRPAGTRRFQARGGLPASTNTYPTLALDPLGRILVPTDKGLARQLDKGWEMVGSDDGLTSNDISSVMQDREGSIWLGLLGSGLARWLGYNEWQSWREREGLSRESVWSIARDSGGRLWVGTQFGLNYAEENGGRLRWRHKRVTGVNMIRSIAMAPDGRVWIGGDPGGLIRLDPRSGATQRFDLGETAASNRVRHVMVDSSGHVWASTRQGLYRGKRRWINGMKFERVDPAGTVPSEGFLMTAAGSSGQVWVAGDLGLAAWSPRGSRRYTTKDGLKSAMVSQVAVDAEGSVWLGYRDAFGITRLTSQRGATRIEHVNSSSGLRSDKSIFLGFDKRGWLWVGTDHGVDVFDRARWRHYGRADGLIWDDCNSNAFLADEDGSVWIGTSKGLSRFRPRLAPSPGVPPPVVFTSVKFGDLVVDDSAAAPNVPYGKNSLQVRFAALTFVQGGNLLYRYRLAGMEDNWRETAQAELNYPSLPPGRYTLEVMARNAQGVWSADPARLEFLVSTPWWLTWWFRVAAIVVCLGLGHAIWLRRTRRMAAEKRRLELAVEERTRELSLEKSRVLEEKARAEQEAQIVQQQNREIARLLEETRQASKLKSEFLANMSHELRTPMNGILGMTDMVLATTLTGEQREYLETARFSADSLLALLNDVLDFSKIEAGRLDLDPIEFSLAECVRQTSKLFQLPLEEKKLAYSAVVAGDVPDRLVGDPDRLRQVLLNLVGNAVKFTERGQISLIVERESSAGSGVVLRFNVRDTGVGIPKDKQEVIFEAFRQADGSTSRKYGGTGLGLAICSRLVELMGGTLRLVSEVGQGSLFAFTARFGLPVQADSAAAPAQAPSEAATSPALRALALPALPQAALPPPPAAPGPSAAAPALPAEDPAGQASTGGLRILVAEDNIVNQRLVTRLLEKRGHQVTLAATGQQAVDRWSEQPFDAVLMDVQMPDMDGLQATGVIREREKGTGRHTPIIALTAHAMKGDRERCLGAGMDNYITKPINSAELMAVLQSAVAASRAAEPAPVTS
jgi:signal transduction histidine kinase/ligand-binding sensor domain-containing protein/ActR/RegA family two-component response regulator